MDKTTVKVNGFEIMAFCRPTYLPSVTVYTPNNTVALSQWGDDDCENLQELVAIGQTKVNELCDFNLLPPNQKALVKNMPAEYVAKGFNISPETATEWKRLAG